MGVCCSLRVVTISPFRVLNRVSFEAVKVDEEQSIVTDPLLLVKSIKSDSYGDGGLRGNFSWGRLLRSFVLFLSKT